MCASIAQREARRRVISLFLVCGGFCLLTVWLPAAASFFFYASRSCRTPYDRQQQQQQTQHSFDHFSYLLFVSIPQFSTQLNSTQLNHRPTDRSNSFLFFRRRFDFICSAPLVDDGPLQFLLLHHHHLFFILNY